MSAESTGGTRGSDGADGETPIRVLLVDDHALFGKSLMRVLGDEPDIDVLDIVSSVEAAIQAASASVPDVILMDYKLEDGTGADATRAIKRSHPEIKIIMLTGYGDDQALLQALETGCAGHLTKNELPEEVARAIRAAAAGEALISAEQLTRLLPQLKRSASGRGDDLTPREREVLALLADGQSTPTIAARLAISLNTARNHIQNILTKLGAHSKLEAVVIATTEGIVQRA